MPMTKISVCVTLTSAGAVPEGTFADRTVARQTVQKTRETPDFIAPTL